jgi:glycosyltransferase involved in cell wall biosynthesis
MTMPNNHDHAYNSKILLRESQEYEETDQLLCPSDFVAKTFLERGFAPKKLVRHQYGFNELQYYPSSEKTRETRRGLTALFVGECRPRKGLHYALEAWLLSSASRLGTFLIAGVCIPGYAEKIAGYLTHPSVRLLGHRNDIPELMRTADILVLPSVEEGSALVTYEARGSGCVLLVSDAAGAICHHLENALVHRVSDVQTLAGHFEMLHNDRALLGRLRRTSLQTSMDLTWTNSAKVLINAYRLLVEGMSNQVSSGKV